MITLVIVVDFESIYPCHPYVLWLFYNLFSFIT